MADEQYRWLDRETAERLLRGESLEAVDTADRDQAERLAKTLEALTAEPALTSEELPGEAAALAAFRAARAARDNAATAGADAPATTGGRTLTHASDAGLVRIGGPARAAARRPRLGRPLRLGLAAALAAGMVGGVAVAAGTGVLPTPFDRDEPAPGVSVPAQATPEHPLLSPSPSQGIQGEPTPGATEPGAEGTGRGTTPGGKATDKESAAPGPGGHSKGWWKGVTSACRDVRDGNRLSVDRRRILEGAAGGSARMWTYCKGVLADAGESTKGHSGQGKDNGKGDGGDQGGKGDDDGHSGGHGHGGDHGNGGGSGGNGHGNDHHPDGAAAEPSSAPAPLAPNRTAPSRATPTPSPSYSAL